MEHQLSPQETFPFDKCFGGHLGPPSEDRWASSAVPRDGQTWVSDNRELRLRRRLLAEAEASEAQATPPEMSPASGVLPRAATLKERT